MCARVCVRAYVCVCVCDSILKVERSAFCCRIVKLTEKYTHKRINCVPEE